MRFTYESPAVTYIIKGLGLCQLLALCSGTSGVERLERNSSHLNGRARQRGLEYELSEVAFEILAVTYIIKGVLKTIGVFAKKRP